MSIALICLLIVAIAAGINYGKKHKKKDS